MSTQRGPASLPGAPGEPHGLIKTLKVHPTCSGALKVFLDSLLHDGELAAREREFLINSVAALRPSPYIVSGHEPIGLAAGLSAQELGLARTGEVAGDDALAPRLHLLRRAAEELVETASLRPEVRDALLADRDPRELLETIYVVGGYCIVAAITRVFALEPEPGTLEGR